MGLERSLSDKQSGSNSRRCKWASQSGTPAPWFLCGHLQAVVIVTGLQTSEREWQRGQRGEMAERVPWAKVTRNKHELSDSCAPMRTQNNKTKSPEAPSTQALLFGAPPPLISFPQTLRHFYFKKVIDTDDPAFTLNFHLSQCKRKAVDNFFVLFFKVRASHNMCQGNLQWQLLPTFSTSKPGANPRVRLVMKCTWPLW